MESNNLKYRMYGLVPYNLSSIQQGIQYLHGVIEYIDRYLYTENPNQKSLLKWMRKDKTSIILNGGTTNSTRELGTGVSQGTLNGYCDLLQEMKVDIAWFTEPDLGDQLTSVVFLADERVWDKEKYPDFKEWFESAVSLRTLEEPEFLELNINVDNADYFLDLEHSKASPEDIYKYGVVNCFYIDWVKLLGGHKNIWLRDFLSKLNLA